MDGNGVAERKKKAKRRKAWIFFQDESGVPQRPSVRATWAPRGQTPVLTHCFNWKKLSIAAALGLRWDGQKSGLFFQTRPGSFNAETLIAFLEDLRRERRGRFIILIWDGLPAHKSRVMKAYVKQQRSWLEVVQLPGYVPDMNPVEALWGNLKGQELANLCRDYISEIDLAVTNGLDRIGASPTLAFSFFKHAGFSL